LSFAAEVTIGDINQVTAWTLECWRWSAYWSPINVDKWGKFRACARGYEKWQK